MTAATFQKDSKRRSFIQKVKRSGFLYLLFLLPLAYYVIFCYWPMYGVTIAFKDFKIRRGILGSDWVGFEHFERFITDPYFWKLVRNTLLLNIYNVIFGFPAPIILALLMNELRNAGFKRVVQTVSYLPHFISTVVVVGMIVNFLSSGGFLNNMLKSLGMQSVQFLVEPQWFRTIYIVSGIWQEIGWGTIIYLAALAGVDVEQYEAAVIDGAGRFRQILNITIPGIAPTISIMLILRLGNIMGVGFEKILLLYNGATYETADVIATYVYRRGLLDSDFSYGTAIGLFQSGIGIFFLLTANAISRRLSETSLW